MKTLEDILSSGKVFIIDEINCMEHSKVISAYERPQEYFKWSNEPRYIQFGFKVAFISICHQFNWDFLQNVMAEYVLRDPASFVDRLCSIDAKTMSSLLSKYPKQERVRAPERAAILRDVGSVISEDFDGDLLALYLAASKLSIQNGDFHDFMDRFEGYKSDPLKKKTNVLTHDLVKENIVSLDVGEDVRPAIDYHIMRLYLRTGRVVPSDETVFKFLKGAPNPRGALVKSLRLAVAEAESLTAYYSGLSISDVNYIEWQIGRSVCLNRQPVCVGDVNILPDDVLSLCESGCPYSKVCIANNSDNRFIDFEEPNFISTHY